MTTRWLVLPMLASGCAKLVGISTITGDQSCFGSGPTEPPASLPLGICVDASASDPIADHFDVPAGPMAIDTDHSPKCTPYAGNDLGLCVVIAKEISIDGVLRATGSRPLALVATTTLSVGGTIDVSSTGWETAGAGSDPTCAPVTAASGGGGGAGGSLAGPGGNGGDGSAGIGGAVAAATTTPAILRGGCDGSDGGNGTLKGHGGGAVYLIAGTLLTITGTIDASGGGGKGGGFAGGAGGGGSGGMIGLDAASFAIDGNARIFANGGGGGEGGGNGALGGDGVDPAAPDADTTSPDLAAGGGNGGRGSYGAVPTGAMGGAGAVGGGGGGGGGGGAGVVRVFPSQQPGGMIAPPPT